MSTNKNGPRLVAFALAPLMIFAGSIGLAKAPDVEHPTPANASANTYGSGWQCDSGFHKANDGCVVVQVPANAHLNLSGGDWGCNDAVRSAEIDARRVGETGGNA